MNIQPIRTGVITPGAVDLHDVLDAYLPPLVERMIVAVTSKIVSLCQGRVVPVDAATEPMLIEQEAERYCATRIGHYQIWLTLKENRLVPNAGVDESNGDAHFILWPQDSQQVANELRAFLRKRDGLCEVGVIITDSNVTPLRRGVTGIALAHSGFSALHDYRGQPDLFGRPLRMTAANLSDGLAAAAVLVMGEGSERTPLALLTELPTLDFQPRNPTVDELNALRIAPEDDLFAPLLAAVDWR